MLLLLYSDDDDNGAHKIVHLGEVLWSREFKGAGELHNLTDVDPGILVSNREGLMAATWFGDNSPSNLMFFVIAHFVFVSIVLLAVATSKTARA